MQTDPSRAMAPEVRLGAFGFPLYLREPPSVDSGKPWEVNFSLGAQLLATDNVSGTKSDRQADFITAFTPTVQASADTAWLRGTLTYAPLAQIYAVDSSQNRLDHNLNAQAVAVLVPQTAFLDARAFATTRTITGGYAPEGTALTDRSNLAQSFGTQISPYLVHRFGSLATLQVGYAFQYGVQDGDDAFLPDTSQPYFTQQEFTAHEGFAVLRSGDDFGRLGFEATIDGTKYSGTGVLDDAHRNFATVELRYAVFRNIAALVEGGYEDQKYGGVPPLQISGPIWAVGMRLTPVPDSTIIVKYGRRNGFNSPFLAANFPVGARTRISASYSDTLSTDLGRDQNVLTTSEVDPWGNPVDATTGAPLFYSGSFLALQSSLFRVRRFTASISQSWPRDTFTFSILDEDQSPVSVAPGTLAFSQRGTSGSLIWAHELTPRATTVSYLEYGRYKSPVAAGSGDVFTASAALRYSFSESLVGTLQYILTNRGSDSPTNRGLQNIILAGLQKTF
ncbi:TIGR03016 family PEP-CTERM system-associated outer membrane protein [Roseomonas xinghualingensis]|uniref:TIGR03016 family PEP-CTERM system-associated outer membrane protein n=1 Tax=Roseomonas xinghualingensis TaxID=2986475 RepID=UPI0021F1BB6E|nr:TIGR03016 family PEP-CTERM system-associated outer membrane protein [Roseomonas sp. SXEYE001]